MINPSHPSASLAPDKLLAALGLVAGLAHAAWAVRRGVLLPAHIGRDAYALVAGLRPPLTAFVLFAELLAAPADPDDDPDDDALAAAAATATATATTTAAAAAAGSGGARLSAQCRAWCARAGTIAGFSGGAGVGAPQRGRVTVARVREVAVQLSSGRALVAVLAVPASAAPRDFGSRAYGPLDEEAGGCDAQLADAIRFVALLTPGAPPPL